MVSSRIRSASSSCPTIRRFAAKLLDIVGLYVTPPEHAVVLSIDEKSQIQALDRTQPGLPMKKGRCGTMTHDYKRHGTTTLFAALNVLDGTVIGRCMQRHRHQEFIRFLNVTEAAVPKGKAIHAIVDNYATHKHPKVKARPLSQANMWSSVVVPKSATLGIASVAGFATTNHAKNQCLLMVAYDAIASRGRMRKLGVTHEIGRGVIVRAWTQVTSLLVVIVAGRMLTARISGSMLSPRCS